MLSVDTAWLKELAYLPEHIEQAAMKAARRTNQWLKVKTKAEMKTELKLKTFNDRLKPFNRVKNRNYTGKLWIGTNDLAAHRFGEPIQLGGSEVRVGNKEYDNAFVRYIGNGRTPVVFERYAPHSGSAKARRQIRAVTEPIDKETADIIATLTPQVDAQFRKFFDEEIISITAKSV